jgi:NAD(P)H-hydrate repair Nnr-like enzyme with NAD(P)H-hydrate epimerase domain
MIKYVNVKEMLAIEKEADAAGLTYARMMEIAGRGLAQAVRSSYSQYEESEGVLGLVGPGNGDTL